MPKYNGHKNWNVRLWLSNDEGLYNLCNEALRSTKTKDEQVSAWFDKRIAK